jgi:hypothetical protein
MAVRSGTTCNGIRSAELVGCGRVRAVVRRFVVVNSILWSGARWWKLRLWCVLAFVVSAVPLLHAAEGIRIVPIVRDGTVLVSFKLSDGFTEDVRAVIRSGLRTTFTYHVDLRFNVPVWIDRTVASAVITNTVQYDNLTRRHTVMRTLDGRVEDSLVTEDENVVRDLMTTFDRLTLFRASRLEPNREYYIRIRAQASPSSGAFLWPWNGGPSGQAKFTFIP